MPDSSNPVPEQSDWDDREILWERKAFYVIKIPAFFHQPIQLERYIEKAMQEAKKMGYQTPGHPMVLFGMGLFHGEMLVEICGVVTPGKNVRVFNDVPVYTAITEASMRDVKKFAEEFKGQLREQGKEFTEVYYWLKNSPVTTGRNIQKTIVLALES